MSQGPGGAAGNNTSRNPVVTPDCRYVAFDTQATNMLATAQPPRLVYRRDLQTGENVLISRADGAAGDVPDADAFSPRITADGDEIVFATRAKNLSDDDRTATGTPTSSSATVSADATELVSLDHTDAGISDGPQGAGFYPAMSADGRYVAFDTEAEDVTAEDANSVGDVVVRDRVADTTTLVSRATGASGAPGDYHSALPQLSADGTKIAFVTLADNLGSISPPDEETPLHRLNVYVRDMAAGTTVLASRANGPSGAPGNAHSGGQPGLAISDDGTKVVFQSQATNLVRGARGGEHHVVPARPVREHDGDGRPRLHGAPAESLWPVISGDGTHVAFTTTSGLVAGDTDGERDVYLRPHVPTARAGPDADRDAGAASRRRRTGRPPARPPP